MLNDIDHLTDFKAMIDDLSKEQAEDLKSKEPSLTKYDGNTLIKEAKKLLRTELSLLKKIGDFTSKPLEQPNDEKRIEPQSQSS